MEFTQNKLSNNPKSGGIKKWLFFSVLIHVFFLVYILPHIKNSVEKHISDTELAEKLVVEKVRFEQKNAGTLRSKIERMQDVRDDLLRVRNERIRQVRRLEEEMRRRFPEKYSTYKQQLKEIHEESSEYGQSVLQALKKVQKLQQEITGLLEQKDYERAVEKADLVAENAEQAALEQNRALESFDYYDAKVKDFKELMAWLQDEDILKNINLQAQELIRLKQSMQEHFTRLDQQDIYMRKRAEKLKKDLDQWQRSGEKSFWAKKRMERKLKQIAKKESGADRLEETLKQAEKTGQGIKESVEKTVSGWQKNGIPGAEFKDRQTGGAQKMADIPVSQLLQRAKILQIETAEIFNETRAAELAVSQNRSFNSANADLPNMEDIMPSNSPVDVPEEFSSSDDLNTWKDSYNTATQDMDRVLAAINAMRKKAVESQTSVSENGLQNISTRIQPRKAGNIEDLAGPNGGRVSDLSSYMRTVSHKNNTHVPEGGGRRLPPELKIWENHFGRKVTATGRPVKWFYIHSWYIIGPFPNEKRRNVNKSFPPESIVDLDAVYTGKNDRTVGWEFFSSSTYMIVPPHYDQYAIYYAYTELYVDRPMDLWIAVGSDDRSDVWINDIKVWQSVNQVKQWQLIEGLRRVFFKKGHNKILLRLENGWRECGFSLLVCAGETVGS
ncbi:hypothetical protein JW935_00400 [candidate division KSB1 bacterium]|nr:hypothetical protein [candidate division KSB1 bacterium]